MASMLGLLGLLGLLEEREASARERVEVLREEAARAAAALEAGEIELDRRVIAREELVDALAASAAETTATTEAEGEGDTAPTPVPAPASASVPEAIVPLWREGLSVSVLSLDNQRILNVLQDQPGHEPARAKDIAGVQHLAVAAALGLPTPALQPGRRGQQGPHRHPFRVRHVRRIPALPVGMIGSVAVHVREAIARHDGRVEGDRRNRVHM